MQILRNLFLIFLVFIIKLNFSYCQNSTSKNDINNDSTSDSVSLNLFAKENIDTNLFNAFPKKYSRKKIALVLSGGGARGLTQIGVISELIKNDIRIDMIVGTSMGSITGGFYASGYKPDEIEILLNTLNWDRALSLTNKYQRNSLFLEQKKIQDRSLLTIPLDGVKPVLLPSSFSNGQYLSEKINSYVLNSRYHSKGNFNNLKIPFTAVATDLDNGKRVILSEGNLSECIKASFTFPLLYSPVIIKNKNLVDGGLTENIPTNTAKKLGADYIIAVNSTSPLRKNEELQDPLNIADQILSITMTQLNNLQLKEANIIITPEIGNYSGTDFSRIKYLIEKGKEKTTTEIKKILNEIDSMEISDSKYFNNFIINPEISVNTDFLKEFFTDTLKILTDNKFEKYIYIEKNLRMIYKTGYYKNVNAVIGRNENSGKIIYNLESNPELKDIKIINTYPFLDSLIISFRKNNLYKPLNYLACNNFFDDILGKLRNKSYSVTEITKFYFNYETGVLEINLNKGFIDNIVLTGNEITNDNVITREITISPNSALKSNEINQSIRNVMSTNLFRQVSFDYDFTKMFKPSLKVNVIEKNTKALRFSMKIDNEYNLQLLLDLRDENLYGSGIEAGFLAAGGLRNRVYQFEVKSNQFFSLPLTFNLNAYYNYRDTYRYAQVIDSVKNEYDVIKTGEYRNLRDGGLSFLFGTQIERIGTVYAQTIFENQGIKSITNSEFLSEDLRVIKLKFGVLFDTQDNVPFTSSGTLLNFYYETANDLLEGSLSYSKLYFDVQHYFPINKSQSIKPRFIFGFADKTTPLTEQYSIGGEKSFFGMVNDELRGRQIIELSMEYRYLFPYKLFFNTYLGVRYDLGNVWQVTQDIRFKDLRHGLGVTAALDTPIGEASFSAGRSFLIKKGLQKDSFIFGPYEFYFSIGYDI